MMVWPVSRSIVNIQTDPVAALFNLFRRPAADRAHRVGWMRGIREEHSFVSEDPVHAVLVTPDEYLLSAAD